MKIVDNKKSENHILIFGHKNPDSDSVMSAIALSHLKNETGFYTKPVITDPVNRETEFALNYFDIEVPEKIENVKARLCDIIYDKVPGISKSETIISVYEKMESQNHQTLPIIDSDKKLVGIVTMKDIAMGLIRSKGEVDTTLGNISLGLSGKLLYETDGIRNKKIYGMPKIAAFDIEKFLHELSKTDIVLVGNRPEVILKSIEAGVCLIIITGEENNDSIDEKIVNMAIERGVPLISAPGKTYEVSRLLPQCNLISSIMKSENIIKFDRMEAIDDIRDEVVSKAYRNFPVTDEEGRFLGFVGKRHLINPAKKSVILVDHNEYSQSADGIEDSEVIEIVDHHKIGDISTSMPIAFRNEPLGSTCTIVAKLYKEQNVKIPERIAGALLTGILSDTLLFKSPTTTKEDIEITKKLCEILKINEKEMEKYAMDMFKAGTSLEDLSIEEIFNSDFKEIKIGNQISGIGQVFTLDVEKLFMRKSQIQDYLKECRKNNPYKVTMLVITDIINEGSYIFYDTDEIKLIEYTFNENPEQGMYSNGLISRKKQLVPQLSAAFEKIENENR